jgi:hypothetical protein
MKHGRWFEKWSLYKFGEAVEKEKDIGYKMIQVQAGTGAASGHETPSFPEEPSRSSTLKSSQQNIHKYYYEMSVEETKQSFGSLFSSFP